MYLCPECKKPCTCPAKCCDCPGASKHAPLIPDDKAIKVRATVRVNAYAVIAEAVERGIRLGWKRAHKHTDTPDAEAVQEQIGEHVMGELTEWLIFDEGEP